MHRGAGSYECGEETALIESLEGKRGQPRIKPPFPAVVGLYGCPTIVNNVETLVNVPLILTRGAEWFASYGTEKNGGPKLYSISGHVARPGSYEAPMGKITLRDLIYGEGYAQGIRGGRKLKAVVPGGSSTPVLTAGEIDVAMDFDGVAKAGSMLGSAGTIVMDDSTCMVWMAKNLIYFYKHESCGKCSPCREGTGWMLRLLERIEAGVAKASDLDLLWKVTDSIAGKTVCPFGDAAIAPPAVDAQQVPRRVRVPRPREALLEDGRPHVRRGPREERGDGMSPSPAVQELILAGVKIAVVVGTLLLLFSVMTWIERRTLAFMQFRLGPNRTGPFGILQPIADGIKLFFKEEVMPAAADKWAFLAAPVLAVSTALLAVAVLPYGPPFTLPRLDFLRRGCGRSGCRAARCRSRSRTIDVGLLFIFAITALGVYGVVLAGWSANNKYSLLGGLRSSAQMFSYELALGLSWVGVIMLAGSFQITDIVNNQAALRRLVPRLERLRAVPRLPRLLPRRHRRGGADPLRPAGGRGGARGRLPHRVLVDALRPHPDGRVHQHDHGRRPRHQPLPRRLARRHPGAPLRGAPRVRLVGREGRGAPLRLHLAAGDAAPRALRPADALRLEGARPGGRGVDPGHRRPASRSSPASSGSRVADGRHPLLRLRRDRGRSPPWW